ncbi:MAG: ADP-glyceromanno-heptose 6-epimerase [Sphingobacteriia bacterium 24-36-13]|jgi:ADP-L-glycero-D-manno-heptose 6-epimerase|uniref:ADP-glyceromanno-heptose 6-epimerase n=1 Tax=Sediminibacterium sp. TaxID=1917865 RepID=UPI000BCCFF80|nr:ADP-glyceromanno-heptose 6-epimerase [Sediminibacterium sp.]OYY08334.1 MAG: ADP-glyceromanno-heptose 6-epimerase [Sphingobacteriia bacterium 35-36-14]OYZ51670.1 MAG: ADP-glyceromanno-heptose 6-epimerase [Sphingobacteriia bacterium 24-36-13]OZA62689.1 MAG: ADP-glyceromanno-heptose 6-epimerase [Sphingobacteriia bacterium 39-36-14]HQS23785.1 ADP-glyceromanno-heptose 6-epimerase [Sediminibacterium sp.]HQS35056.1 ADP-glyceromanno-heptose 6-epimerase [Sediminibacterium sp.]
MSKDLHIMVTGAAGFIGSCMVQYLNEQGYSNIYLVDDFGVEEKRDNWQNKQFVTIIERYNLLDWLSQHQPKLDVIIHLGARTDTTEFDYAIHEELNLEYSKDVWNYCCIHAIPLIYASSAATYGGGEYGYNDDHTIVDRLVPLNPYGVSKNEFDKWALHQIAQPPNWTGLKFFNVYGPNEAHKKRMASVIFHSYNQIKNTGVVKLFKSHQPAFKDGEQLRDFVYVKDVVAVILWMMEEMVQSKWSSTNNGLYNLGTGKARSFIDLVNATYAGMDMVPNIEFIDMPLDISDKYQYFTEANMKKLQAAGYEKSFYTLEEGVDDYVRQYLSINKYY